MILGKIFQARVLIMLKPHMLKVVQFLSTTPSHQKKSFSLHSSGWSAPQIFPPSACLALKLMACDTVPDKKSLASVSCCVPCLSYCARYFSDQRRLNADYIKPIFRSLNKVLFFLRYPSLPNLWPHSEPTHNSEINTILEHK